MKIKTSKFRNKQNGRYTRQLFVENQQTRSNDECTIEPMYSLYYDYAGIPNLRKEYVRLGDPTGYKLTELYFEDYDHWELLMKCKWFAEAKEQWDRELDAKLKSEGMDAVALLAKGSDGVAPAVQLQAAKFLATSAHREKKQTAKRGRPSTEEVTGELKKQAEDASDFAADLRRIQAVK